MTRERGYFPQTTFARIATTAELVRPFLPGMSRMQSVRAQDALDVAGQGRLKLLVKADGWKDDEAAITVRERSDGTAAVVETVGSGADMGLSIKTSETITPEVLLEVQHRIATWGTTLPIPVPTNLKQEAEIQKRIRLSANNARWALRHARPGLRLLAAVTGSSVATFEQAVRAMQAIGFKDFALSGLTGRGRSVEEVVTIARTVRGMLTSDGHLHVLGLDAPEIALALFESGVDSVDGESYARDAARGKRWNGEWPIKDPSALERAHAALENLRTAMQRCGAMTGPTAARETCDV